VNLFTQLVKDNQHVTLDFNPGKCVFPAGINEGDLVEVFCVGEYSDSDIDALDVYILDTVAKDIIGTQVNSETPLHITLDCRNGAKPVESGQRMLAKGSTPVESYSLGMFEAKYFVV